MTLAADEVGGYTVVTVTGEVDLATAPALNEHLRTLIEGGARQIVVDLSAVGFLDSTGLGVLVGTLKRLRRVDGTLTLVCPHERILKVFRLTALDRVFTVQPTIGDAVA